MSHRTWYPKKDPWMPAEYDDDVIYAVRAFEKGIANDGQQKLVWDWLMYLTGSGDQFQDISFRPGADGMRATDFAEGKRFVGQQIRKLLRPELNPKAVPTPNTTDTKPDRKPTRKKR